MNISELYKLAVWYDDRYQTMWKLYQGLLTPLQNNASQPTKVPLQDSLESLEDFLGSISFENLSIQQLQLLDNLGVSDYIGASGRDFVNKTVRTSDFDPATAVEKIREASARIKDAHRKLMEYRDSVKGLDIDLVDFEEQGDFFTIRVGFTSQASINNITDWKKSAAEWYEIIRGISLASQEPPESTKVIGAGTGSIILFLSATVAVTTLLAIISKNVTGVAKNVIEVRSEIENLRKKKLLNKIVEQELNNHISEVKKNSLESVISEVKEYIPDLSPESQTALSKSIQKLLSFNEKGGNVDFVSPVDEQEDANQTPETRAIAQALAAIVDYQAMRDEVKFLTKFDNDD